MIHIGSDHGGFLIKEHIKNYLASKQIDFIDYGTNSEKSVDYPEFAHLVAKAVSSDLNHSVGIIVCGSGNGVSITANKHKGVRCALCWKAEIAALAKQHNNANMISIPGRFVTVMESEHIVEAFLHSTFEGGRHINRINMIENE